jgi:transcriptional regulator with XRE-family HTH domain
MDSSQLSDAGFAALVGSRVKDARSKAALTLDELAESSGVSRRTIVSIEQGATNVSITLLLRISTSLGVGLATLLTEPKSDTLGILRESAHSVSWSGSNGGRAKLVASTESPEIFELWDWVLEPGESHESEAHSDGTHELIHVIQGTLTLNVDGTEDHLSVGDSASYTGTKPHTYENRTSKPTRFSLAVLQPHLRRKSAH